MAKVQGVHPSTVARIWQEHELKPHRQKTFKLSRDAKFVEKLLDVVGIYLNPPQHAIVLCVDEKSQIPQAAILDWLPPRPHFQHVGRALYDSPSPNAGPMIQVGTLSRFSNCIDRALRRL